LGGGTVLFWWYDVVSFPVSILHLAGWARVVRFIEGERVKTVSLPIMILIVVNCLTAIYNVNFPVHKGTVYVLTPMIDLIA
jgi:hypothetical protein